MKPTPTPAPMAEQLSLMTSGRRSRRCCQPTTPAQRRPPLDLGPGDPWRPDLCPALQHALAAVARPGAGLRQPSHLLTAAAGLASRWRVGAAAPSAAGLAGE